MPAFLTVIIRDKGDRILDTIEIGELATSSEIKTTIPREHVRQIRRTYKQAQKIDLVQTIESHPQ